MISLMISFVVTGCGISSNSEDTALVVYYVTGHPFYGDALTAYKKANPKIKVEVKEFDSDEALVTQYSAEISSGKSADVLLLTDTSKIDFLKSAKGGNYKDLTSFLSEDKSYDEDNYYNIIVKAGQVDGKQYALPISFDLGMLQQSFTEEENYSHLNLSGINFQQFLQILTDYQTEVADSDTIVEPVYLGFYQTVSNLINLLRISGISLIDTKGNNVDVDEESFLQLCEFTKVTQTDMQNKLDKLKSLGSDMSKHIGVIISRGNIPLLTRQAEITMEVNAKRSVDVYGIPNVTDQQYHATVKDYGVVSSKSDKAKESYDLIRYIMDYSYVVDNAQVGNSINKTVLSNQLSLLRTQSVATVGNTEVDVAQMREENYKKVLEIMDNISSASMVYSDVEDIVDSTMHPYINNQDSFENCYKQLLNRLEIYSKE